MADGGGTRSMVTFALGLVLGLLCGGLGGAFFTRTDAPEAVVVTPPPPPPPPAPVAVAEAPPPPPPAPEPPPAPAPEGPRPRKATPAPPPAPSPPPPPAPKPAVKASSGPTEVVFVGADGKRHTPDAVPPGEFDVLANWGDGLVKSGRITVKEGKPVKLLCDPPTRTCSAR